MSTGKTLSTPQDNFDNLSNVAAYLAKRKYGSHNNIEQIIKIYEEMNELRKAIQNDTNVTDELGDVLFILNDLARRYNVTLFDLLHQATIKNIERLKNPDYGK